MIKKLIINNCYERHKYKGNHDCVGVAFVTSTLYDLASTFWRHLIIQFLNFRIA